MNNHKVSHSLHYLSDLRLRLRDALEKSEDFVLAFRIFEGPCGMRSNSRIAAFWHLVVRLRRCEAEVVDKSLNGIAGFAAPVTQRLDIGLIKGLDQTFGSAERIVNYKG